MPKLYTSQQVADLLGVSAIWIRRLANERGYGTKLGRDWIFTEEDLDRLRQRPIGKPGRPPKPPDEMRQ